jgi:hypothetical protein
MGIHPAYDQFVSDVGTDYKIAAVQLCFANHQGKNFGAISRLASSMAGRIVYIVNLKQLPFRWQPGATQLSEEEAQQHAKILREQALIDMPDKEDFVNYWGWNQTGYLCTPNTFTERARVYQAPDLPARLQGSHYVKYAIIAIEHNEIDATDDWSPISGLSKEEIKHSPAGNGVEIYDLGHEYAHVFQCTHAIHIPSWSKDRWLMEVDADEGSFAGMRILAAGDLRHRAEEIEETIQGVRHGRALSGFRAALPHYWSALRLDGNKDANYEQSVLSGYELRLRVYADIHGIEIPESSAAIQYLIRKWYFDSMTKSHWSKTLEGIFGADFLWGNISLDQSIKTLKKILDHIDDPLTLRNAELVLNGARYFLEGPQTKPELKLVSENPQPTRSPVPFARQKVYAAPHVT